MIIKKKRLIQLNSITIDKNNWRKFLLAVSFCFHQVHIHCSFPPNVKLLNCSIWIIFKLEPIQISAESTYQVLTLEVRENFTVKILCSGTGHYFASIETAEQKADALCNLDVISRRAIVYYNYEVLVDEMLLVMRELYRQSIGTIK